MKCVDQKCAVAILRVIYHERVTILNVTLISSNYHAITTQCRKYCVILTGTVAIAHYCLLGILYNLQAGKPSHIHIEMITI